MLLEDSWRDLMTSTESELSENPAPYTWNAILAYAATLGWGLREGLTPEEYYSGRDLFRYTQALINVPFIRGVPLTLSDWYALPPEIIAPGDT